MIRKKYLPNEVLLHNFNVFNQIQSLISILIMTFHNILKPDSHISYSIQSLSYLTLRILPQRILFLNPFAHISLLE